MTSATAVRTTTWQLDPAHSSVEFAVKHMMMTTVRGRFKAVSATLTADEEHPEGCCVEAHVATASVDTSVAERDEHLRGPDFFDSERYPKATFVSKRIDGNFRKEGDRCRVVGDLTIRDTTMEVTLDARYEGRGTDPWGKERAGFSASTELDRRDWGLKWNQAIETGGVLVGHTVRVDVEVQFVRQSE